MSNVIDFEAKKKNANESVNLAGLRFGLKLISMPSGLKDNLAQSYHEMSIKLQTIIDLLANNKELSEEHWKVFEELKRDADVMVSTNKHYISLLEAAKKAGYYND